MNSESTFSDALSEVDVAIAAANHERAIALTDELRAARPDALSLWRARARALVSTGRHLEAAEAFERVLDSVPTDADAMADQACTLDAIGRADEARIIARQALDYLPADAALARIAADGDAPYHPDGMAERYREALDLSRAGLLDQAIAHLRKVASHWPLRADAHVALAYALWRNGARGGAAEACQTVLDVKPDCLDAHAILLALWRQYGPSGLDQLHARALDRIDPDHRCTKSLLGDQSPVEIQDVPALRSETGLSIQDEDDADRTDWVDDLVAAANSAPKPLDRIAPALMFSEPAQTLEDDDLAITSEALEGATVPADEALPPPQSLEWSAAEDLTQSEAQDDLAAEWLSLDEPGASNFVPSRPATVVPDANDGVPTAIEPLTWEHEAQLSDASTIADAPSASENENVVQPQPSSQSKLASSSPPAPKKSIDRIAEARRALEEARWQEATELYQQAIQRARGKKLDAIIEDLQAVVRAQPSSKRAWELLAEAYTRKSDWPAADDAYKHALSLIEDA